MGRRLIGVIIALALAMAVAIPAGAGGVDEKAPNVKVFPADGATVGIGPGDTFIWTVDASDKSDLMELEVDNSREDVVPQFTVYASESDPTGGQQALWVAAEASVTYDAHFQTWVIDFGPNFTDFFLDEGEITFYIEVSDEWGNQFGDMFNVTPEMTFTYYFEMGPYDADSCKDGGWADFGFKNQGECIKHVNTR